jgi:hypothetical protein
MQRKSNDVTVNPRASSTDERTIADTQFEPAGTDYAVSWLAFRVRAREHRDVARPNQPRSYNDKAPDVGRPRAIV